MTQQPDKRVPWWLTIDVLIIVIGMMILAIGIWVAPW
jgi:hypothetical protein